MDSLRKVLITNRMLAACLVGTLLWNWIVVRMAFRTAPWSSLGIVSIVLLGLLIGGAIGLFHLSSWGYYLTYTLVPFATIVHGIALVPGVTSLLPEGRARTAAVLALNLGFLIAAVRNHRHLRAVGFMGEGSHAEAAHS